MRSDSARASPVETWNKTAFSEEGDDDVRVHADDQRRNRADGPRHVQSFVRDASLPRYNHQEIHITHRKRPQGEETEGTGTVPTGRQTQRRNKT